MNTLPKTTIQPYDDALHRAQVVALWKSVFGYTDARNDPTLTIVKKIAVLDGLFFVAICGHTVIGTIMAGYDGHRGWIYSLAVAREKRMQSIGTRLLSHAETELKKRGCVKINVQIIMSNEGVTNFYLKNGYTTEARISMGKEIPENIVFIDGIKK